jgi:hypothetical protein
MNDVRTTRPYDARQADLLPHEAAGRRGSPNWHNDYVPRPHRRGVEVNVSRLADDGHIDPHLWQVGYQLIDIPAHATTSGGQRRGIDENADQGTPSLLDTAGIGKASAR